MPSAPKYSLAGERIGEVELPGHLFSAKVNIPLMHQGLMAIESNRRRGTHKTKTRGEVAGGGAKPWRQKGTGRARAGSNRSPLWRGGGTVFGPRPRDYSLDIPKKMKRKALASALSARAAEDRVAVLDTNGLEKPRTRMVDGFLSRLDEVERPLFIVGEGEENLRLSVRNIPGAEGIRIENINIRSALRSDFLILTEKALASAGSVGRAGS